jgi:hypothetical protein
LERAEFSAADLTEAVLDAPWTLRGVPALTRSGSRPSMGHRTTLMAVLNRTAAVKPLTTVVYDVRRVIPVPCSSRRTEQNKA